MHPKFSTSSPEKTLLVHLVTFLPHPPLCFFHLKPKRAPHQRPQTCGLGAGVCVDSAVSSPASSDCPACCSGERRRRSCGDPCESALQTGRGVSFRLSCPPSHCSGFSECQCLPVNTTNSLLSPFPAASAADPRPLISEHLRFPHSSQIPRAHPLSVSRVSVLAAISSLRPPQPC